MIWESHFIVRSLKKFENPCFNAIELKSLDFTCRLCLRLYGQNLHYEMSQPGVDFINFLRAAFTREDPKCKKDSQVSSVVWRFWDQRA